MSQILSALLLFLKTEVEEQETNQLLAQGVNGSEGKLFAALVGKKIYQPCKLKSESMLLGEGTEKLLQSHYTGRE